MGLCKEKMNFASAGELFPAPWANCSREVRACARSSSPCSRRALLALTPLKVAFCARAEEKAGAALGVFPCVGGLALRIARARAQRRRPARKPEKERKSGRPFPCFGPLPAACLRMCAWSSCAPRAIWGLTMPASHPRWPRAFCRRFCALWARPRARGVAFGVRPGFSEAAPARRTGGNRLPARGAYYSRRPDGAYGKITGGANMDKHPH